ARPERLIARDSLDAGAVVRDTGRTFEARHPLRGAASVCWSESPAIFFWSSGSLSVRFRSTPHDPNVTSVESKLNGLPSTGKSRGCPEKGLTRLGGASNLRRFP